MSTTRNGAPTGRPAFPAATRLHTLIEWLRSGRPLTTVLAAEALGVSRRTVTRDLNHLRNALCLSIRYDPVEGTYALTHEHAALPFVPHPDIIPALLSGTVRPETSTEEGGVHVRFSQRSVHAYAAVSGLDLADAANEEGQLDLHFDVTESDDLLRWLLSCGAEAEVLAPEALRGRLVMEIRRMLDVYHPGPGNAA